MTKIFYGRDLIGRFTCDGKRYTRFQRFMQKVIYRGKVTLVILAALSVIQWSCYATYEITRASVKPTVVEAQTVKDIPIVMQRIAHCEGQTGKTNGQVTLHTNKDGSIDVGKYQINLKAWGKKATELGLDLTKDTDNETMAMWIYENKGTGAWYSSESCWK